MLLYAFVAETEIVHYILPFGQGWSFEETARLADKT